MTRAMTTRGSCALLLLMIATAPAHAQIEAGRVIDDSTHAPLTHLRVSLEQAVDTGWMRIDSTHTDARGLFQFTVPHAGAYRVGFGSVGKPLFYGGVDTLAADSMQEHEFPLPLMRTRDYNSYFEFQVDHPAQAAPGNPVPVYPPEMRSRGIEGEVAAQFVVTPDGKADTLTFKVLRMTDRAFALSVLDALPKMTYKAGSIGGIPVRQVVQQMFEFNLRH